MIKFIGVLVSIIVGIFGVIFGSSQRKKRKAAEEQSKKLAAELELKVQQSQTAAVQEAAHAADVAELVEADDSEIIDRANSLFGTDDIGDKLRDLRLDKGYSYSVLSKLSGISAQKLVWIEKSKGVTEEIIGKLAKVYDLSSEEKKTLLSMIKEGE